MKPETAKAHLKRMLRHFTAGSILHLLAEVIAEPDPTAAPSRAAQQRTVEEALFVLGLGVDADLPHREPASP